MVKKLKVALVLGGGGARGLAHIGVLKVLEKNNIKIDFIAGASMGAIIGAWYAQNPDALMIEKKLKSYFNSEKFKKSGKNYFRHNRDSEPEDLLRVISHRIKTRIVINLAARRISLMKGERLRFAINEFIKDTKIENTKIPFACVATDLISGSSIPFYSGPIRDALQASAAIPGYIPPVKLNGQFLVDGSVCNNFPIDVAKNMGANFIIVCDVSPGFDNLVKFNNVIDIIIRSNMVSTNQVNQLLLRQANFVFRPDTNGVHWSEFDLFDKMIESGEQEARDKIKVLQKQLSKQDSLISKFKNKIGSFLPQK